MSLDELLATLQKDYLAALPAKIRLIEKQIHEGESEALRESFHKLRGTGRTYGLGEVSDLASVVEDVCAAHPSLAAEASAHGLMILRDIYDSRQMQRAFDCLGDPRLDKIRKLLPSESSSP